MARRVAVAWNWIEMSVALYSARSIEKKGSRFSTNHSRQKKTLTLGIASQDLSISLPTFVLEPPVTLTL